MVKNFQQKTKAFGRVGVFHFVSLVEFFKNKLQEEKIVEGAKYLYNKRVMERESVRYRFYKVEKSRKDFQLSSSSLMRLTKNNKTKFDDHLLINFLKLMNRYSFSYSQLK